MPPTNAVMDFRTFARSVLGRQPGMVVGKDVSTEEFEADKKAYDYYVKKGIDQAMSVQQPPPEVTGGSFTNAEGRVTDYIVKPKGVDVQLLEPRVLTTPGGTFTMKSPTNAVPVLLPDGSVAQNYTGDPTMGAPAPTIGGPGMAATNAPTAAPAPTPQQLREGSVVRQNGVTYKIVNGAPVPVTGP